MKNPWVSVADVVLNGLFAGGASAAGYHGFVQLFEPRADAVPWVGVAALRDQIDVGLSAAAFRCNSSLGPASHTEFCNDIFQVHWEHYKRACLIKTASL